MIYTAPDYINPSQNNNTSIFLGGTINMGNSTDWQAHLIERYSRNWNIDIYNPRRPKWNGSLEQDITVPEFYQQVNWELNALDRSSIIVINFEEDSKSPISLLELGLYAISGRLLVRCPKKFYRSGNIQIVCDRFRIPLFETMKELYSALDSKVRNNDYDDEG